MTRQVRRLHYLTKLAEKHETGTTEQLAAQAQSEWMAV